MAGGEGGPTNLVLLTEETKKTLILVLEWYGAGDFANCMGSGPRVELRASGPTRVKLTCHRPPPSAWHAATPAWPRGGEARPLASHTRRGGGPALLRTRHALG